MKTLQSFLLALLLTLSLLSCSRDASANELINSKEKLTNKNLANRNGQEQVANLLIGNNRFELNEDNSAAYHENEIYLGDIILDNFEVTVHDNRNTTGTINLINDYNDEEIIITNIREFEDKLIFDIQTSTGFEVIDVEGYQVDSNSARFPPPLSPLYQLVQSAISSLSDGISAEDCISLMPKSCPNGYIPYAQYSSSWFSSSCQTGCRKK